MKRTHYLRFVLLLAGLFLFGACQKDEPEQPHGVKINFQAVTGLKGTSDTLLLEEAYIGIGAIDLMREGEADSAIIEKIVYDGPYVVDLLKGTVSPAIRWIFAEPGKYRKLHVATYNSLPYGNTIILKGSILPADGAGEIPFELFTAENHTFDIVNSAGITISEGEDLDLLVVFNLSKLFSGIDLNGFEKNEQGVLVISEENGGNNFTSLIHSFEAFSSFGINNGQPFPETGYENPDDKIPGEVENPEEDDEDDENEPDDDSDDEQDDGTSGDESGDLGNNGGGTTDEDEDEDSTDNAGNDDNGNEDNDNSGSGNGDTSTDDDDGDSENDEGTNDGSGSGDDGQDSGNGNGDENDEDNSSDEDDDGTDDDDGETDDEDDDDNSEDDNEDNEDDSEEDDDKDDDDGDDDAEDDDKEDKDNNSDRGKGNDKGKGDKGKGNK